MPSPDLHDAQILRLVHDFEAATVVADVLLFPSHESPQRVPATISFRGVSSVSIVTDFDALADNRSAGNVHGLISAAEISYLYLMEGCVAVRAKEVSIEVTQGAA